MWARPMAEETRRYTFSPLERRGVLLGLDGVQLSTLVSGGLAALTVATSVPGPVGVPVAALLLIATGAFALWPAAGQPAAAWLPVAVGWLVRRSRGAVLDAGPLQGVGGESSRTRRPAAPARVRLLELPTEAGQTAVGVVRDSTTGTWAAAMGVRGRSFSLLDPEARAQRLDAWRAVLGALARPGSPIARVQWVERSGPSASPPTAAAASGLHAAIESYEELVAGVGSDVQTHQVWLVLAVGGRRRTSARPGDVLRRELRLLEGQLRQADLQPQGTLGVEGLTELLAAPHSRRCPRFAWPTAADEWWAAFRTDGAWHATFWIAEWPRIEVGSDFLLPMMIAGGRRTVSVTMAPVPAGRAMREARAARTADIADTELRHRAGFLPSIRRDLEADGTTRTESELAAGHAEFRFSGYVTVTAADRESLEAACAETEHASQAAHLELRRLYGRQAEAYTWTLPLCRGLRPSRRA